MKRIDKIKQFDTDKFTEFLLELCEAAFCGKYTQEEYNEGREWISNWLNSEVE